MRRTSLVLCFLILGCTQKLNPPAPQIASNEVTRTAIPTEGFDELPPMPGEDDQRPFHDLRGQRPRWSEKGFEAFAAKADPADKELSYIIVTPFGDRAYVTLYNKDKPERRGLSCKAMSDCMPRAAFIDGNLAYLVMKREVYRYTRRWFERVSLPDTTRYEFSTPTVKRDALLISNNRGEVVGILEFAGSTWQIRYIKREPKKSKNWRVLTTKTFERLERDETDTNRFNLYTRQSKEPFPIIVQPGPLVADGR